MYDYLFNVYNMFIYGFSLYSFSCILILYSSSSSSSSSSSFFFFFFFFFVFFFFFFFVLLIILLLLLLRLIIIIINNNCDLFFLLKIIYDSTCQLGNPNLKSHAILCLLSTLELFYLPSFIFIFFLFWHVELVITFITG